MNQFVRSIHEDSNDGSNRSFIDASESQSQKDIILAGKVAQALKEGDSEKL